MKKTTLGIALVILVPTAAALVVHVAGAQQTATTALGATATAHPPPGPSYSAITTAVATATLAQPPTPLPGLGQGALKGLGPLSSTKKVQIAKNLGLLVAGENALESATSLSVRSPYGGPNVYMSAYGWNISDPHLDPPETIIKNNDDQSFVMLSFRVDANRSYLVDCTADGPAFKIKRTLTKPAGGVLSDNVGTTTATDHHVSTVVQKDAAVRQAMIWINAVGGGMWSHIGTCDITPMK
jgi:hypothetical protein